MKCRIEKGILKSGKEATREADFVDNYCYHAMIFWPLCTLTFCNCKPRVTLCSLSWFGCEILSQQQKNNDYNHHWPHYFPMAKHNGFVTCLCVLNSNIVCDTQRKIKHPLPYNLVLIVVDFAVLYISYTIKSSSDEPAMSAGRLNMVSWVQWLQLACVTKGASSRRLGTSRQQK